MKKLLIAAFAALAAAAAVWLLFPRTSEQPHLRLYAGAGLRPAVEKLIAAFEKETGVKVEPDYGGSGLVLSRVREDRSADLFLPGEAWYVDQLEKQAPGSVAERSAVSYFVPTIIVAKGNPKGVNGLADLARADLRVGLGKADACQVGRVSAQILAGAGVVPDRDKLQESLTVNELGVWVKMQNVDAAIVWEAIAANLGADVETISIPLEKNSISEVVMARLSGSGHPKEAGKFLAFVKGSEGQAILKACGYRVDRPALPGSAGAGVLLLAAASAIDAATELAAAFEKKTGVRVRVSTGASNALAAQIIAGVPGEVFLSANPKWAGAVEEKGLALESRPLLTNRLVIVVPKGNPAGVASPADLLGAKVRRVALAGEKVPAGMYAEQALRHAKVYDRLLKDNRIARGQDVRVALRYVETGEAEAGVVYATDARSSGKVVVVSTFPPESHEQVVYPLVLLKSSGDAATGRKLFNFLTSPEALAVFEKHGFAPAPAPAPAPAAAPAAAPPASGESAKGP